MRTYGRQYFDTATATDIVISNGASSDGASTFVLKGSDGSDIASNLLESVSAVYRTDWQGRQLLYDTPRTNLFTYSQDLSHWNAPTSWTLDAGNNSAPDGSTTAYGLTETTGSSPQISAMVMPVVAYVATPIFVFVKRLIGTRDLWIECPIFVNSGSISIYADLDALTATVASTGGSATANNMSVSALDNGWFMVYFEATYVNSSSNLRPYIKPASGGAPVSTGDGSSSLAIWGLMGGAPGKYISTTSAAVTVTDYTISRTDITLASPLSGWYSGSTYNYALLQWSGTYYGAVNYQTSVKKWVEVDTDANGYNDSVYLTTLAQVLKLNLNESPFFANYGIPQYQTIMSQVFPDYYVNMTQTQFAQYFASLTVARLQNTSPTYRIQVQTNYGSIIDMTIAA